MKDKLRELAEWMRDVNGHCADALTKILDAEGDGGAVGGMSLFTGTIGGVHVGLHGTKESVEALDAYLSTKPHSPDAADSGRVDGDAVERAAKAMWEVVPRGAPWSDEVTSANEWRMLARAALAQNAQGEAVAWMCETVNGYTAFSRDGKFPCNAGKISPLYLHAERARVPDGWGLKPSKATGDMVLAGIHENLSDPGPNVFNRIWAAMFAAAPSQPEGAESGA